MRHGKPYLLKDGQPMNADEALFIRQKAGSSTAVGQPLLGMRTLPLVAGHHEKSRRGEDDDEEEAGGDSSGEESSGAEDAKVVRQIADSTQTVTFRKRVSTSFRFA